MGTWGPKPFQNDAALDWVATLDRRGTRAIEDVLNRVVRSRYSDADEASSAVAAAAIVAAAGGNYSDELPEVVEIWIDSHRQGGLISLCMEAAQALDFGADAVGSENDGCAEEFFQRSRNGSQAERILALAFGLTEMGANDQRAARLPDEIQRGNRRSDAVLIGDPAALIERNIQIAPHEDLLPCQIQLIDAFHSCDSPGFRGYMPVG